jgi:cytochrome c peroxidase
LLDSESAFEFIAQAIAGFERTDHFSLFTSKFDAVRVGIDVFTQSEMNGQGLFNQKADCRRCHNTDGDGVDFFTDFEYKNIGTPVNPNNPFLSLDASLNPDGTAFVDLGLGAVLNDSRHNGKFRTPTLRNIAMTAPYMHNGVFNTLEEVIGFYNRRDVDQIEAEVDDNVDNGGNIGNLNLSQTEITDLAAFLRTLSDN